jgi:Na+(H+)/acetate symporter ActP
MRLGSYLSLALFIGLACTAIGWLGLAGWLAALVIIGSLVAHVAGNALGTRLRDATDERLERPLRRSTPLPAIEPSLLRERTSLGRLVPVSVGIGAVCGGIAGGAALLVATGASTAGAALGGVSSAVIGGLGGFLAASFVEVIRTSLREAIAAERRG